MPLDGHDGTRVESGVEKPVYTVEFTNGAYEQLRELAAFLKTDNLLDVVKFGISIVERAKEYDSKKHPGKADGDTE
jgi:hypothetical protein